MEFVKLWSNNNKNYYSYRLKSSKVVVVFIKGTEFSVPSHEIKKILVERAILKRLQIFLIEINVLNCVDAKH